MTGDSMLLYCLNADDEPHFISGIIYNTEGAWSSSGLVDYGFNESALPSTLKTDGNVALPFSPNYIYIGPQSGKRVDLVESFQQPKNYNGSLTAYIVDTSAATTISSLLMGITVTITSFLIMTMM